MWDPRPRQINTPGSANTLGVSKRATRLGRIHTGAFTPLTSLALGSGPAGAKPVFVKSVLANLPECAADMRPNFTRRGWIDAPTPTTPAQTNPTC
jgi:hypothetical protein